MDYDLIYKKLESIEEKITVVRVEVAELKVKATAWGVLGGVSSALLVIAIKVFFDKK